MSKEIEFISKDDLCYFCKKRKATKLCDYQIGIKYIRKFNKDEMKVTCNKQMCDECSSKFMFNSDICPDCLKQLKIQLSKEV